MTEWEFFTADSYGHILDFQRCEYCQVERPVQQWDIAEEDSDNIASITLSYPFQIKQLMKEVDIYGNGKRKHWVCLDCLSEIEEQK